jgi:fucose 4-O-acetylase-like acetyltransferase
MEGLVAAMITAYPDNPVMSQPNRIEWIDVAKGIGIILVVMGHVLASGGVYSAIYLFHMPMFFILSGMVFKPGEVRSTVWKKTRSLMIPYLGFVLIVTLLRNADALRYHSPVDAIVRSDEHQMLLGLIGGRSLAGDFGTFWFVSCLFLSLLAYNGLRAKIADPRRSSMVVVMAVLLIVSYPLGRLSLPWDASVVPLATVFIWVGECMAIFQAESATGLDHPALIIVSATIAFIGFERFSSFDMKMGVFGTPYLSVIAAIACSHLFFIASKGLCRVAIFRSTSVQLGRATLVILFLHRLFVVHLKGHMRAFEVVVLATAVPFAAWLVIKRCPAGVRQALLGEQPPHTASLTAASGRLFH